MNGGEWDMIRDVARDAARLEAIERSEMRRDLAAARARVAELDLSRAALGVSAQYHVSIRDTREGQR